jgi:hypothetical protein
MEKKKRSFWLMERGILLIKISLETLMSFVSKTNKKWSENASRFSIDLVMSFALLGMDLEIYFPKKIITRTFSKQVMIFPGLFLVTFTNMKVK